jgi:hypothetical protein
MTDIPFSREGTLRARLEKGMSVMLRRPDV